MWLYLSNRPAQEKNKVIPKSKSVVTKENTTNKKRNKVLKNKASSECVYGHNFNSGGYKEETDR